MILVIAGMYRSGSTFTFNVAKELLGGAEKTTWESANSISDQYQPDNESAKHILKSHEPDETITKKIVTGETKCICTIRRPEDAALSLMRIFDFDLDVSCDMIARWCKWHRKVAPYCLNIEFQEIETEARNTIRKINEFLKTDRPFIEQYRIWRNYRKSAVLSYSNAIDRASERTEDFGFSFYDRETFFHRQHVTSLKSAKAIEHLTAHQLAAMRSKFEKYIDHTGDYKWPES